MLRINKLVKPNMLNYYVLITVVLVPLSIGMNLFMYLRLNHKLNEPVYPDERIGSIKSTVENMQQNIWDVSKEQENQGKSINTIDKSVQYLWNKN